MLRASLIVATVGAAALALAGCSDSRPGADEGRVVLSPVEPGADDGHTHSHAGAAATVGDGTTPTAGGYTLADVRLPRDPGQPGDLTFRIEDVAGAPLMTYTEEQTKLLHLYVVRDDLQDFRHLHPTLDDDGTWTARLDLAGPGPYRVLAEFTPGAETDGDHVVLGSREVVPGPWEATQVTDAATADDGIVEVRAPESVESGPDEQMTLTVSDADGGQPALGSYLGASAHLTGFDVETGQFVHAHPSGEPVPTDDGTELTFHTEFEEPGRYRFFVQVRVDGFVHTVPVAVRVI